MSLTISNFVNKTVQSAISFLSIILKSRYSKLKKDKNGSVFLLANGPSINASFSNQTVLNKLINTDCLCVNYFYKSDYFKQIKPIHYIVAAPEIWESNVSESYEKNRTELFNALMNDVDWDMTFYIPNQAKKHLFWQDALSKNKNISIQYYNINPIEGFEPFSHFMFDLKRGMPRSHNIVGYSLMTLIWKGYSKIGLLGVDHTWTKSLNVTENNDTLLSQPHFYNTSMKQDKMNNTIDGTEKRKLHEVLHKFQLTFKSYFEIKQYGDKKNIPIYNLTKGSFIDAFDRIDELDF
jgi:hypothetical protein